MLAKKHRLTHEEFGRCFASGRRYHGQYFTIIRYPAPSFQAAVVVGKKVYKKAHERNRLRRQLYHALRVWWQECGATGVVIILTKPAITTLPQQQRAAALTEQLAEMAKDTKKR